MRYKKNKETKKTNKKIFYKTKKLTINKRESIIIITNLSPECFVIDNEEKGKKSF